METHVLPSKALSAHIAANI